MAQNRIKLSRAVPLLALAAAVVSPMPQALNRVAPAPVAQAAGNPCAPSNPCAPAAGNGKQKAGNPCAPAASKKHKSGNPCAPAN